MTDNKLGTITTAKDGRRYIVITTPCPACGAEAGRILDLPCVLSNEPDGRIIYVGDLGVLFAGLP
jgi:hypothetical protein